MKDLIYREDAVNAWKNRQPTMATTGMFELLGDLEHGIPSAKVFTSSVKKPPMKPIRTTVPMPYQDSHIWFCGKCGKQLGIRAKTEWGFCPFCSQPIDWTEEKR